MEFRKGAIWTLLASWFRDHHKDGPELRFLPGTKSFSEVEIFTWHRWKLLFWLGCRVSPNGDLRSAWAAEPEENSFHVDFGGSMIDFFVIFHRIHGRRDVSFWDGHLFGLPCSAGGVTGAVACLKTLHWIDLSFCLACDILWFLELINWDDQL